ncbi:ATP-binding protein [Psychrobacter sp. SCQQ22]|uniref:HD domain-containing protein n=1 Tax=Psychrobacter sp. SCQQ22 TaxID=2792059 RepID=UPI0018CEF5D8|nr:ATP-binding protein [Psychrobacter sp. SCQQ22]MBH0084909.1 ATP-binding protein [Psychrobacter sp. SCQQ22]
MSAGLIKHLRKKTDEDSNTKILMSQWEFDEKLVGKSLENVGSYYPHFSSHNESHSQQILVNIERLLGSNIEKLTATDTWLILEAAYWHDIGMLFNADEVQDVIENDHFKDYVEELANNNVQDLHEFAKVWHNDGWEAALVHYDNPYKGVEKYRQMVAEWYRRDHPTNSERVVLKPFEKLNISSPRTELLPNRIYRYLAQICLSHGKSFNYVMKDLPFRQTGMGTEDCHPRFVACLLRLGDLFDIDDNRFCPVMARQVGNMPSFSETHKHKHQAIREFQLDNETVSVTAVCSTEMAYIECRNWFDWIKEEIQNQMSQWKNIVPSRDFGLLPTINKLNVEMTDKKILLNDKPMKFSLDERSAIELLQGNNLYKDDMSIYRELIQNAIDATMIRVWLEHGQEHSIRKLPENANPYDAETCKLFADYPITLDCKKIADNKDSTLWEFSIEDNGVGISRIDLEYMQKIAGSKNNREKQKIIRQMPPWMRPSGEFGIGMHSAFLLMKDLPIEQQRITIFTKSRLTHESLRLELHSPLSDKAGYCFITKVNDLKTYGTKLIINEIFEKDIKKFLKDENLSYSGYIQPSALYSYQLGSYNALEKVSSIFEKISNPVVNFNLSKKIETIIEKSNSYLNKFKHNNKIIDSPVFWNLESKSGLKIKILNETDYENSFFSFSKLPSRNLKIFYKGQYIDSLYTSDRESSDNSSLLKYPFIEYSLDMYDINASQILTLSRDSIHNKETLLDRFENMLKYLEVAITENKFDISTMISNPIHLSLLLNLFNENYYTNFPATDEWKKLNISDDYTIEDILHLSSFTITWSPTTIKQLPDNINISNHIDSETMKFLVDNSEFLQKSIKESGFHSYIFKDASYSGAYSIRNTLYSKNKIDSNLFENIITLWEDSEEDEDENEYILDYIFDLDVHPPFFPHKIEPLVSAREFIDALFNEQKNSTYDGLFFTKHDEEIFLFPYIENNEKVIEITNTMSFNLINSFLEISFEEFDKQYNEIKKQILNKAKNSYPEWYKAYERGQSFRSIDLSSLDELHKPST